jgi:3-hydroxymyristoyl/3-hydroxydecanoyl-(acyl carrier protein) dehydratase
MKSSKPLAVAAGHPAYPGHFPNFPVLPGAVLLDEALQVIAAERGIDLRAWHIASAKFTGAVKPGDALWVEFDADQAELIRFQIFSADRRVVSGMLSSAVAAA